MEEIDPLVRAKLSFIPVSTVDEVIPAALVHFHESGDGEKEHGTAETD